MRDAGVPSGRVPAAPPVADQAADGEVPRRRWRPPRRLVVVAAVVATVAVLAALFVIDARLAGRPALSTSDVNGIVNTKVKAATTQLQSEPPTAATVYAAARGGLVVVEADDSGKSATAAPGASVTAARSPATAAASTTAAGTTVELGTGIVIDAQGDIMTALHVVQGSTAIKVTFANGTSAAATIKSSEPSHDIAVLSAAQVPSTVVPEVLGGGAEVGEPAFVVGNPLGLVGSLSAGVVSGLDRSFPLTNGRTLTGMIQFDAAVNPGNSGGPLLNAQGQVMGIVTGLANPAGADSFAGIGFAVPIDTAGQGAGLPPQ